MTPDRIHDTLIALAAEPVPDVDASWSKLQRTLPARSPGFLQRVEAWVKRPLVVSVATVTLGTGAAYAAGVDPVRDGVAWAWDRVAGGNGEADERLTDRQSDVRREAVLPLSDERNRFGGDDASATGNERSDASRADDKRGSGGAGGDSRDDDADDRTDQAEDDADDREDAAEDAADDRRDAAEDAADDREDAAEDAAEDREDEADDRADQAEDAADDREDAAEELEDRRADEVEEDSSDSAEED